MGGPKLFKAILAGFCLCAGMAAQVAGGTAQAPAAKAPAKQRAPFRSECVAQVGFCVSVPGTWKRVGDIYDDLGFVVAQPQTGSDPANWPQLTVVAFEPPEGDTTSSPDAAPDSAASSLDQLVDRMLTPSGALASAQTLQRSRTLLNGSPAEIVRVQFRDNAGKANTIEEVALIEGDDGMVYSVALHCAPQEFERLEPVFQQATQNWHLKTVRKPAPAAKPQRSSAPASPAPAKTK